MGAAGYRREPHLLLATLRAVAAGRLQVRPGAVLDGDGNLLAATYPAGLPLTDAVEAAIAASTPGYADNLGDTFSARARAAFSVI